MTGTDKNPTTQRNGLHHVTVQTRDWETALRLYRDVLKMPIVAEFEVSGRQMAMLDTGNGSCIELIAPTAPPPPETATGGPLVHLALATPDAAGALERIRQAGYEIVREAREVRVSAFEATVAFFKGPSGELIELFQPH